MSYDVFVGLPSARIIRTTDLLAYLEAETDWDANPEGYKGEIHPRLAQFAIELSAEWPAMYASGPLKVVDAEVNAENNRTTGYSFCPTSIYLDFRWSCASEAYEQVRKLAVRHQLLFFNCSGLDWINATRRPALGRQGRLYLLDRDSDLETNRFYDGETMWIEPGDIDLLTDPDWFITGCHFGYEFGDEAYMQTRNAGETFEIEYRRGSADQHFGAKTKSLEDIRKSFQLYCEQDERAFSLLAYEKMRL